MNCQPKCSSTNAMISRVPLFEGLDPEELAEICIGARKINAARGEMLFRKDDVIASCLNLTQEHFSRILHDLSTCGLLSVEGRDIHIENLTQFWQCACQIVSQVEEEQQMEQELIERSEQAARGSLVRLALATVCS